MQLKATFERKAAVFYRKKKPGLNIFMDIQNRKEIRVSVHQQFEKELKPKVKRSALTQKYKESNRVEDFLETLRLLVVYP